MYFVQPLNTTYVYRGFNPREPKYTERCSHEEVMSCVSGARAEKTDGGRA